MNKASTNIPEIERLSLPSNTPSMEAIRSCNQNLHSYTPEFWELEYVSYRYLAELTDKELHKRHKNLLRNIQYLTAPERNEVPIISNLSSWYWFRKEHQTRLEMAMRSMAQPKVSFTPKADIQWAPKEKIPSGTKLLFRYGELTYMRDMVRHGKIRVAPAEDYDEPKHNAARRDKELTKKRFLPGRYSRSTTVDGQDIPIIGDIKVSTTGPKYYFLSLSCIWTPALFNEFDADICVVINEPTEFMRRIEQSSKESFPEWYFHHNPIQYFDPYERRKDEYFSATMSKDFLYAYQNEYRILWDQIKAPPVEGYRFLELGDCRDIMTMHNNLGHQVL